MPLAKRAHPSAPCGASGGASGAQSADQGPDLEPERLSKPVLRALSSVTDPNDLWPEKFLRVLEAFGPLPSADREAGQLKLATGLAEAAHRHRIRQARSDPRFLPASGEKKQLQQIGTVASRLLRLLGVREPHTIAKGLACGFHGLDPVATGWILPTINRVARERRGADSKGDSTGESLEMLLISLSDLVAAAKLAGEDVTKGLKGGRGGKKRETPKPQNILIRDLIDIYAEMRQQFPQSGPSPAWGGPLQRFLSSSLDLLGTYTEEITARVLEAQWRQWNRTNQN